MAFNMVILLFLAGFIQGLLGLTFRPFLSNRVTTGSTKLAVATSFMGSDSLERPDDENSPEFQVYLKQLLNMQSTRSKAGFAAPSSGSADAYIAKLSRMKIERNARVRAGLPDAPTNSGYLPIDYKAAILEAQEPLIRSSPIQEVSGARVRAPSQEEIYALRLAQETVERELAARSAAQAQNNILSSEAANAPPTNNINKVYSTGNVATQSDFVNAKPIPEKLIEPIKPTPSRVAPPAPQASAPPAPALTKPPPVQTRAQVPASTLSVKPVAAAKTQPPKISPASNEVIRKLTDNEMQSIADAVGLLVKHRGGGPFGAGRLQGLEVSELITSLQSALSILDGDANYQSQSQPTTAPASHSRTQPQGTVKSPQISKPTVPVHQVTPNVVVSNSSPAASTSTTTVTAASRPLLSADMASTSGTTVSSSMTLDELIQTRDSLIRSLSAVQSRIDSMTSTSSTAAVTQTVGDANNNLWEVSTQTVENEYNDNEIASSAAYSPATTTATSAELQAELRKALGLLLKHRGGPGFGHGRLEREELTMMQNSLRKIARELYEEAVRAAE